MSPGAGSGPTESAKSWYWPGPIAAPGSAVQVTVRTASVRVAPSTSTAVGRGAVTRTTRHPGTALACTEANGGSWGSRTLSFVVLALSDSLGTRKVSVL